MYEIVGGKRHLSEDPGMLYLNTSWKEEYIMSKLYLCRMQTNHTVIVQKCLFSD